MKQKFNQSPNELRERFKRYLDFLTIQYEWLKDFNVDLKPSIIGNLLFITFQNTNTKELCVSVIEATMKETQTFNSNLFDEHIQPYI